MRLDLLLKRELFEEVFTETLTKYLTEEYDWRGTVVWKNTPGVLLNKESMIANGKLNVIYPNSLSRTALGDVTAEYEYNKNRFKHFIQKTYVRWATIPPIERLTTIASIKIEPWIKQLDDICIIPGNHTLRIINFSKNHCVVLHKIGHNIDYFHNETRTRKKYPYINAPLIYDISDEVYTEERIIALPLNRLCNEEDKHALLKMAQDTMLKIYNDTSYNKNMRQWLDEKSNDISSLLNKMPPIYDSSYKNKIDNISMTLHRKIDEQDIREIEIVHSHGDFQPANIMLSSEEKIKKHYLIDWEYSGERYRLYDALVFSTQSRFPSGLNDRVTLLLENKLNANEYIWSMDTNSSLEYWMVAAFLLEDLILRLEEQIIPCRKEIDRNLISFLSEIEKMDWLN